ncbi:hypothetical protein B0J18DRAFT_437792 [Chaetomium sp. MPI-SDFR-AT-0129]|nr:hypothetical protein B0J18DRAFT_437792 [Chaetomium sp. MPI-SDFR-AT-0129]
MRQRSLLNGALRANACQFSQASTPHTFQTRAAVIAAVVSRQSSRSQQPRQRRYASDAAAHDHRHQGPSPSHFSSPSSTTTTAGSASASSSASLKTTPVHDLAPSAANPPATTRPPPLDLPSRPAGTTRPPFLSPANFSHLYATGMTYVRFYKTGLKHIITNTRLVYNKPAADGPPAPLPSTRAHLHLRQRWSHDVRRLPLFALILLVCGEFTPLVVLVLPSAVPLTCRIPRQADKVLRGVQGRRAEARAELALLDGTREQQIEQRLVSPAVLAGVLGLRARAWTPGFVAASRVERRLRFLAVDDALLVRSGGARALVPEEVRLACTDRGVDVLGRGDVELRGVLERWLRLTDARRLGEDGREKAVSRLLLSPDHEWGV